MQKIGIQIVHIKLLFLAYRSFDLMHTWCCGVGFLALVQYQRNQLEYFFIILNFMNKKSAIFIL